MNFIKCRDKSSCEAGGERLGAETSRGRDRGLRTAKTKTRQAAGGASERGAHARAPRTEGGGRGSPAYISSNVAEDSGDLNGERGRDRRGGAGRPRGWGGGGGVGRPAPLRGVGRAPREGAARGQAWTGI